MKNNKKRYLDYVHFFNGEIKNSKLPQQFKKQLLYISDELSSWGVEQINIGIEEQNGNETIAIVSERPKTHALFFDRIDTQAILDGSQKNIPFEYVNRLLSVDSSLFHFMHKMFDFYANYLVTPDMINEDRRLFDFFVFMIDETNKFGLIESNGYPDSINPNRMLRLNANNISAEYGVQAVPVYINDGQRNIEFRAGAQIITERVIDNLDIVVEEKIDWKQVKQFRNDVDARLSYSKFLRYLKSNWEHSDIDLLTYEIERLYFDYKKAIKKHGFSTAIGFIKNLLSIDFVLPASIASVVTNYLNPGATPYVVGAFTAGKIAVNIAEFASEIKSSEKPNEAIAWICDLKRLKN